jgi:hypothetical protein
LVKCFVIGQPLLDAEIKGNIEVMALDFNNYFKVKDSSTW